MHRAVSAGAVCAIVLSLGMPKLGITVWECVAAQVMGVLVSVLAVRALGVTDLNPVSGVGKLSQIVFAVVSPGKVLPNLVAGAISEAGACAAASRACGQRACRRASPTRAHPAAMPQLAAQERNKPET